MKKIGKITHYYGKAGAAIVKLDEELKIGDRIRIEKNGKSFDMTVNSIEKDRQAVEKAGKGEEVGINADEKAKEGAVVYILEE